MNLLSLVSSGAARLAWRKAARRCAKLLSVLLPSLILAACGGGGSGSGFVSVGGLTPSVNQVVGNVVDGPVAGATVCAYTVVNGQPAVQVACSSPSDASGAYTINLASYANAPVILVASGGTYVDAISAAHVNLNAAVSGGLHGYVAIAGGGTTTAVISPLTELAYDYAAGSGGGVTAPNWTTALGAVQTNFGVSDIVGTVPIDPAHLPTSATPSPVQINYALALATLSEYLHDDFPSGTALSQALSALNACLSVPVAANCGTGSTSAGYLLSGAMVTYLTSTNPAFAAAYPSASLSLSSFGSTTASGGTSSGLPLGLLAGNSFSGNSNDGPGATAMFNFTNPSSNVPALSQITVDSAGNLYAADTNNNTIRRITAAGLVSTLAGQAGVATAAPVAGCTGTCAGDGVGTAATFSAPNGAYVDTYTGNLFVGDSAANAIRMIVLSGSSAGQVSTIASGGVLNGPGPLTGDGAGNLFVMNLINHTLVRLSPATGGSYAASLITPSLPSGVAHVGQVTGLAYGGVSSAVNPLIAGKVLLADSDLDAIWAVDPASGATTDYASPTTVYGTNANCTRAGVQSGRCTAWMAITLAPAVTAAYGSVWSLAVDAAGTVYALDAAYSASANIGNGYCGNTNCAHTGTFFYPGVWRIGAGASSATLLAGGTQSGVVDGIGSAAAFYGPTSIALSATTGLLYLTDTTSFVRTLDPASTSVATLAGMALTGFADGTGIAAKFAAPSGLATDGNTLYVADAFNCTIRAVTSLGQTTTIAGLAGPGGLCTSGTGFADGIGTQAVFGQPFGVAADGRGALYVADYLNNALRKVSATTLTGGAVVTTVAGQAPTDGVTPGSAGFADGPLGTGFLSAPEGVAVDTASGNLNSGNIFIADTGNNAIRMVAPANGYALTTFAGNGSAGFADGAGASSAQFSSPAGIAVDGSGNVYVADTGNNAIRKITPDGTVSTLAGPPPGSANAGVAATVDGIGGAAQFSLPLGIVADSAGNLYVSQAFSSTVNSNNLVRKVTPAGQVTTITLQTTTVDNLPTTLIAMPSWQGQGLALIGRTLYLTSGSGIVSVANLP